MDFSLIYFQYWENMICHNEHLMQLGDSFFYCKPPKDGCFLLKIINLKYWNEDALDWYFMEYHAMGIYNNVCIENRWLSDYSLGSYFGLTNLTLLEWNELLAPKFRIQINNNNTGVLWNFVKKKHALFEANKLLSETFNSVNAINLQTCKNTDVWLFFTPIGCYYKQLLFFSQTHKEIIVLNSAMKFYNLLIYLEYQQKEQFVHVTMIYDFFYNILIKQNYNFEYFILVMKFSFIYLCSYIIFYKFIAIFIKKLIITLPQVVINYLKLMWKNLFN